jgi:hypothetical protein
MVSNGKSTVGTGGLFPVSGADVFQGWLILCAVTTCN